MNAAVNTGQQTCGEHLVPRPPRAGAIVLAAGVTACLCSCSMRAPAVETSFAQPLPLALRLNIKDLPESLAPYGTAQEWHDDFRAVFSASKLCQSVRPAGDPGTPDADVTIAIRADAGEHTEIDAASAVVTTLAWSCVPPLHFFVPDVGVVPGLRVTVSWTRAEASSSRESSLQAPVYTNYLQRYPFFSWETLGTIVAPSFVFSGGEREHLLKSIAARVRFDVAVVAAKALSSGMLDSRDLLGNLALQSDGSEIVLRGAGSTELYKVVLRLDDPAVAPFCPPETLPPVPRSEGLTVPIKIRAKLPAALNPSLLRIEATSRTPGRPPEHYSLRVENGAPSTEEAR